MLNTSYESMKVIFKIRYLLVYVTFVNDNCILLPNIIVNKLVCKFDIMANGYIYIVCRYTLRVTMDVYYQLSSFVCFSFVFTPKYLFSWHDCFVLPLHIDIILLICNRIPNEIYIHKKFKLRLKETWVFQYKDAILLVNTYDSHQTNALTMGCVYYVIWARVLFYIL